MKTRYDKKEGCVPDIGAALQVNLIPPHFQRNPVEVELDDGQVVKSCHLYADGRMFNFRHIYCTAADWEYLYITQLSYLDSDDNTQVVEVQPRNPHHIDKSGSVTMLGHVTKIDNKRWGITVTLNWETGDTQIVADDGCPIVGALIQLI